MQSITVTANYSVLVWPAECVITLQFDLAYWKSDGFDDKISGYSVGDADNHTTTGADATNCVPPGGGLQLTPLAEYTPGVTRSRWTLSSNNQFKYGDNKILDGDYAHDNTSSYLAEKSPPIPPNEMGGYFLNPDNDGGYTKLKSDPGYFITSPYNSIQAISGDITATCAACVPNETSTCHCSGWVKRETRWGLDGINFIFAAAGMQNDIIRIEHIATGQIRYYQFNGSYSYGTVHVIKRFSPVGY